MKKLFIVCSILIFSINLSLAQTKEEKKKIKEEAEKKEFETTKSLIKSGEYKFIADWATTQSGTKINLATNHGYLKIEKENAEADLPYFGDVQVASNSGKGGIEFKNEIDNYAVEFNDKKKTVTIQFKATEKSEFFNLILTVFKSGNASLDISSNKRNSIGYDGKVNELSDPK